MGYNQKKGISLILIFLSILTLVVAVSVKTHSSSGIFIKKNNYKMTLQEAIQGTYLDENGAIPSANGTTSLLGAFHNPEDIYIKVNGVEQTLQQALDGEGLCSSSSGSYDSEIIFGHSGEEIELLSGKTLQESINDGDFCAPYCGDGSCNGGESCSSCSTDCGACAPTCTASCGSCSVSCGGGTQTCTRTDCSTYTQSCNTQACAPTCTASCGSCSVSCGGGTQTCTRTDCSTYTQSCNTQACAPTCTASCGSCSSQCDGTQTCTRTDCSTYTQSCGGCTSGYHCSGGSCVADTPACTSCPYGTRECQGDYSCTCFQDTNGDGCYDWTCQFCEDGCIINFCHHAQ